MGAWKTQHQRLADEVAGEAEHSSVVGLKLVELLEKSSAAFAAACRNIAGMFALNFRHSVTRLERAIQLDEIKDVHREFDSADNFNDTRQEKLIAITKGKDMKQVQTAFQDYLGVRDAAEFFLDRIDADCALWTEEEERLAQRAGECLAIIGTLSYVQAMWSSSSSSSS